MLTTTGVEEPDTPLEELAPLDLLEVDEPGETPPEDWESHHPGGAVDGH